MPSTWPSGSARDLRAAALLLVLLLTAGCADGDEVESLTPRITVADAGELAELLLTADDVEQAGFVGFEARDIDDVQLFENPDMRGPCGAPIQFPVLDGAAGRAFVAGGDTIVQIVVERTEELDAVVDAYVADAVDGCPPFESMTNQGLTQQVSDIEIIDISSTSERSAASAVMIEVGGQPPIAAWGAAMILGDHFVLLQGISRDEPTQGDIRALIDATASTFSDGG